MHVEFHGAARTVTGSCTLLEAGGTRILVDCGQFQGDAELERRNVGGFAFDPRSVDALVMTHAHVDHVGRAPLLVARGFRGTVLCTRATAELASVMLLDAAKILEEDAEHGGPAPAWGEPEVRALYAATRPIKYGQPVTVGPGVAVTLSDAGHILGSAHVLATLHEGGRTVAFGVSGDVGSPGRPVVADPTPFRALDYLQVESTYGDRDHKSPAESIEELDRILEQADGENGVVLVPAFSLGRTQDILYHLNELKNAGRIPHLAVYVDSPLATRVTRVFEGNSAVFDDDAKGLLRRGDDPFDFPGLTFVGDGRESARLTREARRCVIIASSGMCQGGRIVRHLEALLPRPSTKVVIVGYQAPHTLGRRLVEGRNPVFVRGRPVAVRATVHTLGGFSAHAGRGELLDWVRAISRKPSKVFLCHGEPPALEALARGLRDELGLATHIPDLDETVEL
jgi:metallo-beta-lactamase family protein